MFFRHIHIVILPWPGVKPAHKVSGAGLPARQINRVQKKFLFVKSDHLCNHFLEWWCGARFRVLFIIRHWTFVICLLSSSVVKDLPSGFGQARSGRAGRHPDNAGIVCNRHARPAPEKRLRGKHRVSIRLGGRNFLGDPFVQEKIACQNWYLTVATVISCTTAGVRGCHSVRQSGCHSG